MPEVPSYWERPLCPSSDQCLSPSGKRIPPQEPPPPAWPPSPAETQAGSSRAALGTLRAAAAMHCPDPGYLRTRSHPGLCRPGPGRRDPCPSRQAPGALSTVVAQVWASLPRAICQRLLTWQCPRWAFSCSSICKHLQDIPRHGLAQSSRKPKPPLDEEMKAPQMERQTSICRCWGVKVAKPHR